MKIVTENGIFVRNNPNHMPSIHYISSEILSLSVIKELTDSNTTISLSEEAILNINKSYDYLQQKIKDGGKPIYGINTGFGSLYNV
ncbi:MAG: aromatic amino acid ammonia-lyase, partial [Bacteroidetes bacterium]|nr:aromatic amino acid ammonia-lyase [Bacteroidota bacterium]